MEIKLFYKTQRELANALNTLIDSYWNNEIEEDKFIEEILRLYKNNSDKIIKDNEYTKILQQQCGKRRLEVVSKVMLIKSKTNLI